MGTTHGAPGRASWWALGFALFTLAAQIVSDANGGWKFVRTAFDAGAWWQLITAQWVHFGTLHSSVNVAGLAVLLVSFQNRVAGRLQAVALLGGYLGVALVLVGDANCAFYAGASGALHGLLAGNLLSLWLGRPSAHGGNNTATRVLAITVLLGLGFKLLLQHPRGDSAAVGWLGFATYYPAHEAGTAGGLLAVVLVRMLAPQWFGPALCQLKQQGGTNQV